jgi:hypothetical protein
MKYTCAQGETWDSIAYQAFKDEMMFPTIMDANRKYNDVVIFDGGEVIEIPDSVITDSIFVTTPFQSGGSIRVILPPWS